MSLQLISFAWRILNMPVADFAAVNGARDNSIRKLMEEKSCGSPQPWVFPGPEAPTHLALEKKVRKMTINHIDCKACGWGGRFCFGGSPP